MGMEVYELCKYSQYLRNFFPPSSYSFFSGRKGFRHTFPLQHAEWMDPMVNVTVFGEVLRYRTSQHLKTIFASRHLCFIMFPLRY